jgi:hypothetical protein
LVLVVLRTLPDGTTESVEYEPSLFGSVGAVHSGPAANETLQLYVEWCLEPRDWRPQAQLATHAYVEVRSSDGDVVLPTTELWDPYEAKTTAASGGRTLAYYTISISPDDLRTAFGAETLPEGRYVLSVLFRTHLNVTDPLGAVHEEDLSLEYRREYEVVVAAPAVTAEEEEAAAAGAAATETTVYDISATLTWQLVPMEQARFSLTARREHLLWIGAALGLLGALALVSAATSPALARLCRVVAR